MSMPRKSTINGNSTFVNGMKPIESLSDLEKLTNTILGQLTSQYKIQTLDPTLVVKKPNVNGKHSMDKPMTNEEKETPKGPMYQDISEMERLMKIPDELKQLLVLFEESLSSKAAKQHISRNCAHPNCNIIAPSFYPNNIFLCDEHRKPLYEKLESYNIAINKGSVDEREKCKKLRDCHQNLVHALKIPHSQRSFGNNQYKYPSNYFVVCMAKLLLCQQEFSKPVPLDANLELRTSHRRMKRIIKKLMNLLIAGRQNLNCHWCEIFEQITNVCISIQSTLQWLADNNEYIEILSGYIHFFVTSIIEGIIYMDRDSKFVAGAAAVGTGVGAVGGAIYGAELGLAGGPAGAAFGAAAGFLIGGGMALIYRNMETEPARTLFGFLY